jgi:DNA-binding NtrC family response regulator
MGPGAQKLSGVHAVPCPGHVPASVQVPMGKGMLFTQSPPQGMPGVHGGPPVPLLALLELLELLELLALLPPPVPPVTSSVVSPAMIWQPAAEALTASAAARAGRMKRVRILVSLVLVDEVCVVRANAGDTKRTATPPGPGSPRILARVTTEATQGVLQIAVFSGDAVAVHRLPPGGRLTVGRAPDSDLCVDDHAVSRRHAIIHAGPPLAIEDLGGANATMLSRAAERGQGGETVALRRLSSQRVALAVGDRLSFGAAVAVVRREPPPPSAAPAGDDDVVIRDPGMRRLYEQAGRAAQGLLSVLVLGETGVGKDVLARAIHRASPRASRPFLAINCAALSESLLESELFGHEKGAFTGALQARPGLFESADGGTVFLDEIGDLPMVIQVKLLRVLEQREVLRVGARAPRPVDVRFVSATNRDLEAASAAGTFRQDLYFRLNGISLTVPPLRERPADVPWLVKRFLVTASRQMDRPAQPSLSPEVLASLQAYAWPGNVRELRNVVDRAVALAPGDVILPEHLPPKLVAAPPSPPPPGAGVLRAPARPAASAAADRLRREVAEEEKRRILDALAQCDGNQTRAAELLGVSRRTLINRIIEFDLPRPRKR